MKIAQGHPHGWTSGRTIAACDRLVLGTGLLAGVLAVDLIGWLRLVHG